MRGRLLRRSTLTIDRDNGDGYHDEQGRWVEAPVIQIPVMCNIQPFKMETVQMILPEGFQSSEARTVYTKTLIRTSTQFGKEKADKTTINNLRYYAMAVENWSLQQLRNDHYRVIFVRDDQDTAGGL